MPSDDHEGAVTGDRAAASVPPDVEPPLEVEPSATVDPEPASAQAAAVTTHRERPAETPGAPGTPGPRASGAVEHLAEPIAAPARRRAGGSGARDPAGRPAGRHRRERGLPLPLSGPPLAVPNACPCRRALEIQAEFRGVEGSRRCTNSAGNELRSRGLVSTSSTRRVSVWNSRIAA